MGIRMTSKQELSENTKDQNLKVCRRGETWKSLLEDYLKNSTVVGCNNYVTPGRHPHERKIWMLVHIVAVIAAIIIIFQLTYDFAESPTVTTMETDSYPIQDVDFPGVAICSINKISSKAAHSFAEEIWEMETSKYQSNFTFNEILSMVLTLGHLYNFEMPDSEKYVVNLMHHILERSFMSYSVNQIMFTLTPTCRSMLRFCSWEGKEQSCEDIFFLRRTMDGYCCTFNYARRSDSFGNDYDDVLTHDAIERSRITGPRFGLSVLLDPHMDDYFYKLLPLAGFKILIYPSMDYPDAPSGGLREVLVPPRSESYLNLEATSFYSVPDVIEYDVAERNCLFNTELSKIFGGYYSYSDCVMYCRISDIVGLCKCNPFFYPSPEDTGPVKVCDLEDLPCLNMYRRKWTRMNPRSQDPTRQDYESDSRDPSHSLSCHECFPACEDVLYKVSTNTVPLSSPKIIIGREPHKIVNHSIVHISFGGTGTPRLRQDVLLYWYELMSNYGGICGLFLGISVISVLEILYFLTLRLHSLRKNDSRESGITLVHPKQQLQPLYWKEIMYSQNKY